MLKGASNSCIVDKTPGKSLSTAADGDYAVCQQFNRDSIRNFTITGWWKPNGAQSGFAALASSGDWCAHCLDTEGLIIDYFGTKLWYKWPGVGNTWGNNSGLTIPLNEWSYIALTIEPTKATLYLNDQKYIHNRTLYAGCIQDLFLGYGHYDRSFKGEIDEVTVWNRTLNEDEIRLIRHLTKEGQVQNDGTLISYYQFDGVNSIGMITDKTGGDHAVLHQNASLVTSSAPIASGASSMLTINGAGTYNFGGGLDLSFANSGTYPGGKVVVSRLDTRPNIIATQNPSASSYWIMNNYGTNGTFTALNELKFKNIGVITPLTTAPQLNLHRRVENGHVGSWNSIDNGDLLNSGGYDIKYNSGLVMQTDGQFMIDNVAGIGWIGAQNYNWDNPHNWGTGSVPKESDEVIIPAFCPYFPRVNISTIVKFILLQKNASLEVLSPNTITTKP
jgi:Concanavalin A-like lectin/glucanases superfamily